MRTDTMIYLAVALSATLPLGTIGALLLSERRWRERELWLRDHCIPSLGESSTSSAQANEEPRLIQIQRRPFHEALWEDEPGLAPSPRVRAIVQELAARSRHDEAKKERTARELGLLPAGGLPVVPKQKAPHLAPPWRGQTATEMQPATEVLENDSALAHEESDEMKWSQMAATAALAAGMASGCSGGDGSRWHELPRKPEFRLNPHPKEKYELTVTIANAPGPFVLSGASAFYRAPDCAHMVDRWAGASGQPAHGLLIEFFQINATTWRGTFYRDGMLDEDYDGPQGAMLPCHWRLQDVGPGFTASGALSDTYYSADMDWPEDGVPMERTEVRYYYKPTYPSSLRPDGEAWHESGDTVRPDLPDSDLFTITLTARRVQP